MPWTDTRRRLHCQADAGGLQTSADSEAKPVRIVARCCRGAAAVIVGIIASLWPVRVQSHPIPCAGDSDAQQIAQAMSRLARSVDPCGESRQVVAVLNKFERCTNATYQICTNTHLDRNVFDRPIGQGGEALPRTISWNPELRSELERGCNADAQKPVVRDPTASLLHEIVHAVQDCEGLNPGEHEFEAVRIENIYRRASGLCQRGGYGNDTLPVEMVTICTAGDCACSHPAANPDGSLVHEQEAPVPIDTYRPGQSKTPSLAESAHQSSIASGDRPK